MKNIEKTIADLQPRLNQIADKLVNSELLAQLAEEASELSQAALKRRRVIDGKNPTPVTEVETLLNLHEELADVLLCVLAIGFNKEEIEEFIQIKSERWHNRIIGIL